MASHTLIGSANELQSHCMRNKLKIDSGVEGIAWHNPTSVHAVQLHWDLPPLYKFNLETR